MLGLFFNFVPRLLYFFARLFNGLINLSSCLSAGPSRGSQAIKTFNSKTAQQNISMRFISSMDAP